MNIDKSNHGIGDLVLSRSLHRKIFLVFTFSVFVLFSCLYAIYTWNVSYDVFYEADFLHIPFIAGLIDGGMSVRKFMTAFGEHLFPGYNLILFFNYILFKISGSFTVVLSAVAVIISAVIVVGFVIRNWSSHYVGLYFTTFGCSLSLLSPTNNAFWGMALAAQVGTLIVLLVIFAFCHAVCDNRGFVLPLFLVPVAFIFFLGGYSAGFMAVGVVGFVLMFRSRPLRSCAIYTLATFIGSVILYILLVYKYGALFSNVPSEASFSLLTLIKFALVMSAASVLGSTLIEQMGRPDVYFYVSALLLLVTALAVTDVSRRILRRNACKLDVFVLLLITYSIVTILFVSFFRFRNGVEGGTGQWYATHIKFLPVGIFIWLGVKIDRGTAGSWRTLLAMIGFVALTASVLVGFRGDWIKSFYVREWKAGVASYALDILATREDQLPPKGPATLLWDPVQVKRGLELFYRNDLWVFRSRDIKVKGLQEGRFLSATQPAFVACPVGTTSLTFTVTGAPGDGLLKVSSAAALQEIPLGQSVVFAFPTIDAVARLSLEAARKAGEGADAADGGPSAAIEIRDLECHLRGPVTRFPQ